MLVTFKHENNEEIMDYTSFENLIKSGKTAHIYVLFGEETYFLKQSLAIIKEGVLKNIDVDLRLVEYSCKDVTFQEIFDDLWTVPLLGIENRRLIIVEDAGDVLKKYKEKMQKYFLSPSPYACLVMVCNKIDSWVKKISNSKFIIVECTKLRDRQLQSWIVTRARKKYNKKVTRESAEALVEETGNNLILLENHLAKLSIYVGDNEIIDEPDVRAITFDEKKQSVFELTNAMANKDKINALKTLKRLIILGEDFSKIISLLGWQVRRLLIAKRIVKDCVNDQKKVSSRFCSELKINQFYFNGFFKQVGRFNEEDLEEMFGHIAEADVEIKTSTIDSRIIVECLLIKLCK